MGTVLSRHGGAREIVGGRQHELAAVRRDFRFRRITRRNCWHLRRQSNTEDDRGGDAYPFSRRKDSRQTFAPLRKFHTHHLINKANIRVEGESMQKSRASPSGDKHGSLRTLRNSFAPPPSGVPVPTHSECVRVRDTPSGDSECLSVRARGLVSTVIR